jgi:hypothetical protein
MPLTQVSPGLLDSNAQYYGFKNRIINGAMVIDQRNNGAEINPATNNAYCIDRWLTNSNVASKFKIQQNAGSVTPPAGFTNYLGATSLSAYTVTSTNSFALVQKIEGFNISDLSWGTANAKTITLSFQVYSSLTGTFGGALLNSAQDRSYPFSYTISSANTWTTISVTIAGDTTGTWLTTNGVGIQVWFSLGMGSTLTGTAGAWAAADYRSSTGATSVVGTNGATFYITGVQLEKGSTATSFDYRPYGAELALCQRYFQKFQNGATPTGALCTGTTWTTVNFFGIIPYVTTMRATPTGAVSASTAVTYLCNGVAKQATAISLQEFSANAFELIGTNSGMTAGQAGFVRFTSQNDFVTLSAEL